MADPRGAGVTKCVANYPLTRSFVHNAIGIDLPLLVSQLASHPAYQYSLITHCHLIEESPPRSDNLCGGI